MICADTNIFVDFFRGTKSQAVEVLQRALDERQLIMNPFVLSELLSSPKLPAKIEKHLLALPRLEVDQGLFERAGFLRRNAYVKGKGISMADVYIAQSCIDAHIPLLTCDQDLQMLSKHSDLDVIGL